MKIKLNLEEKHYGHACNDEDIAWMWKELLSERAVHLMRYKVEMEQEGKDLDAKQKKMLEVLKKRLENFGEKTAYAQMKKDLLHNIGRVSVPVARKTTLSSEEEKIRSKLTWMDHDYMQWVCACSIEELEQVVCEPKKFQANLHKHVLEYEDEIGVFIGMRKNTITVDEDEHEQKKKRYKLNSKTVGGIEEIKKLEKEAGGGMKQQRGPEEKGQDKKRITLLHRLILADTVQGNGRRKKPRGRLERTVIVLPGIHCNADYFDIVDNVAVWNRDWSVEVNGETVAYYKGKKLGVIANQLQMIKKAFPELMQRFLVLQQPAAFRDEIIVGWCMEDLHRREKYVLQQHDLLGCQSTAAIKQKRWSYMIPDAILAGEMTASEQLTDIMIAHYVKYIARQEMPRIRQWLKERAKKKKTEVKYAIGSLEILLIAKAIDEALEKWLETYDFIFYGARQGGHLAYLPDVDAVPPKMITVEEAAKHWPDEVLPEGMDPKKAPPKVPMLGGGKLDADWLQGRYDWKDAEGRPLKPDWKEMDIKGPGDQCNAFNEDDDHCILVPDVTEDAAGKFTKEEQEIFDAHSALLQDHPAVRHAMYTEMLDKIEALDKPKKGLKKAVKVRKKQPKSEKIRRSKANANYRWRTQAAQYLSEGYTPEEIAERIVLKAGKKKTRNSGSCRKKVKTATGAICLKAAAEKLKLHLADKKMTAATKKMITKLGPMVGKKLKLKKDNVTIVLAFWLGQSYFL